MNAALLQHVRSHILDHPERFCAAQWATAANIHAVLRSDAAGHVLVLGGRFSEAELLRRSVRHDDGYAGRCAAETLALSPAQRNELFYPSQWAEPYRSCYYMSTAAEEAAIAAAFIEHFLGRHAALPLAPDRPAVAHGAAGVARPQPLPAPRS